MSEEEQIILPEGFRRVEYLESTGSQYLNLSITTKVGDKIVLETESKFLDTSNQAEGKSGNPYFFYGISGGKWYCGAGGYSTSSISADTEWHKFRLIHSQNDTGLYIDDIKIQSQTYNSTSIVLNGTINAYRTYNGSYFHKTRKKSWKLYINDDIVYNLVPCIDNYNVPCMYDLVSQKPFYNQGSGTFLTNKSYEWNYPYLNNSYNLPAGFKKCVYLQSDGTQWIDTGIIPNNETGLYFKALQLSYGNFVPFGVEENNNNTIYPPRFSNKELYYKWGGTTVKMMTWDTAGDLIFRSSLNLYNSKIAKFNSEDTDVVSSIASQSGTYTLPIWLFSYNYRGAYSATYGKWTGRIFRAQITQGDALIHDYVPCLDSDNRPCMYDLIEQEALYNQSGGTEFTYCVEHQLPSDFIKLKYLEDTGNQYIDIGIIPTNETGLYVDAQQITHTNTHVMGSGHDTINTGFGAPRFLRGTANSCGFMWKGWISYGNIGNGTRFEGYLNFFNNRKANLKTAGTTERINNLGELGFTPTASLHMFRANYSSQDGWNGRIYRAKITQGTELIKDFVPAYDTRKTRPCMYDLIKNDAYYNDGEGEFLYNNDFEGNYEGFGTFATIGNKLGSYNYENEKE